MTWGWFRETQARALPGGKLARATMLALACLTLASCGVGSLQRATRSNCPETWEKAAALCQSRVDCGEVGSCWYLGMQPDGAPGGGDARLSCISNFGEARWSCGF